jgi:hypothetical protein
MIAAKRFTYWTADGKRHWTPLFDPPITLDLSQSAKFAPADKHYDCRTRKELLALARPRSGTRQAKELRR